MQGVRTSNVVFEFCEQAFEAAENYVRNCLDGVGDAFADSEQISPPSPMAYSGISVVSSSIECVSIVSTPIVESKELFLSQ